MTYRIEPLPLAAFAALFTLDDEALMRIGARRTVCDAADSAPCRVSLRDADPGDRLILLNHMHLDNPISPYRASGPIFVREAAIQADPTVGAAPSMLTRRLLSMRLYDREAMMIDADVVEGIDLDHRLRLAVADPAVFQVHLHTARRGCYLARAVRND